MLLRIGLLENGLVESAGKSPWLFVGRGGVPVWGGDRSTRFTPQSGLSRFTFSCSSLSLRVRLPFSISSRRRRMRSAADIRGVLSGLPPLDDASGMSFGQRRSRYVTHRILSRPHIFSIESGAELCVRLP